MRLERCLWEAASRFEAQVDELAGTICARMRTEIKELRELEAPEIWEAIRRVSRESRRSQAIHLRRGRVIPQTCPQADVEAVQGSVQFGVSLPGVLQAYRIAHSSSWAVWLELVEGIDASDAERSSCLRAVSQFAAAYDERIVELLTEEYERESETTSGNPDRKRARLVRELIDGVSESSDGLDYRLDLTHIGVVAWGSDARAALRELAAVLDRRPLVVPAEDGLLLAWLGG